MVLVGFGRKKRRGELPFEISPLTLRFIEDPVRSGSQPIAISESFGSCERSPRFPSRIRYHKRAARAFLGSIRRLPVSRLPTRVSLPILFSGSFPGPLARSASSSLGVLSPAPLRVPLPVPGVPFPAPLRVPLPVLLKFLPRHSCEHRFRFSDGSCLLSSSGGLLLC